MDIGSLADCFGYQSFQVGPNTFLGLRICGCNIQVSKSALVVGGEILKAMVGKVIGS